MFMNMSKRVKFFLGHFCISLFIASIVVGMVFFIWYPSPLAKAVNVTHIFLMMLMIDVIIGPVLGLLVYKDGKKTLKFDLTVIILIQLSALCYGVYTIAQGRPVWIVYSVDRFELVKNNEIIDENLQKARPEYQYPSWLGPQFIAMQLSLDREQRSKEMFDEVFSGVSLAQHPERYVKLSSVKAQIQQRALPLVELQRYNQKTDVEKTLAKYPKANAWLPLKATAVDMVVLITKEKAEVVKIVDLRPWK